MKGGEGRRKGKKKGFHLVASAFDSDFSFGACDNDAVVGELRRRGRNGREKRKAFIPLTLPLTLMSFVVLLTSRG